MDIKQIKELLENAEFKAIIEAELTTALKEEKATLEESRLALEEEKKQIKKEMFVQKKMLVAKSALYEQKLKGFYDAKLTEAVKKMSSDVFTFIEGSINGLTKTIAEDTTASLRASKQVEAFSQAARILAPFMDINELAGSNATVVEDYKKKLNSAKTEIADLRSKILSDDVQTLVVKECTGYPLEKQVAIINTLKELAPKTLVEAKDAIAQIKVTLRKKQEQVVAESKVVSNVDAAKSIEEARAKLLTLAEDAKKHASKTITESKKNLGTIDPTDVF